MSNETTGGRGSVIGGYHTNPTRGVSYEAKLYRLQRENPMLFYDILAATQQETKRKVLSVIVSNETCLYNELEDYVTVSTRNLKKHVYALCDASILDRSGNPTVVSFPNETTRVLVSDVLNSFDPLRNE